jgi:integrase/recombinase XerD
MMTTLSQAVDDYIKVRRALGAKLTGYPRLLTDFVAYLEAAGASTVTTELAVAWARLPGDNAHRSYLSRRLCVVRGFARHLQAFDPATEVPPAQLVPGAPCRAEPYLYCEADVVAIMAAARSLTPTLRAATYETAIGLLKTTGMRVGEVIRLDQDDLDWDEGVLTIRDSKFNKSREVPLHPSTLAALRAYASRRDQLCPDPSSASFFVSQAGSRLVYVTVQGIFARLAHTAGLRARSSRCRPRLHDWRHCFASSTLLGWYRAGVDVEANLPLLSTYLGHTNPASTYWYLSAVPELLALAAERRERTLGVRP